MVLAAEHSFFSGRSLWQLILGGVFERFPDLKLAFVETEAWWIGPMMELARPARAHRRRLDRVRAVTRPVVAVLPAAERVLAVELLRGHLAVPSLAGGGRRRCGSADRAEAGFTIHSENAMFGVDYPHPESIFPNVIDNARLLAAMPQVTEADARKVLYENAAEVFHLDLAALQPEFDRVGFDLDDLTSTPA